MELFREHGNDIVARITGDTETDVVRVVYDPHSATVYPEPLYRDTVDRKNRPEVLLWSNQGYTVRFTLSTVGGIWRFFRNSTWWEDLVAFRDHVLVPVAREGWMVMSTVLHVDGTSGVEVMLGRVTPSSRLVIRGSPPTYDLFLRPCTVGFRLYDFHVAQMSCSPRDEYMDRKVDADAKSVADVLSFVESRNIIHRLLTQACDVEWY